jgi:hypothetical protein
VHPDALASVDWFYARRGATYGPVSAVDLRAAAHLGFLGPNDLVRKEGRTDWVLARTIPGLFSEDL